MRLMSLVSLVALTLGCPTIVDASTPRCLSDEDCPLEAFCIAGSCDTAGEGSALPPPPRTSCAARVCIANGVQ